MAGAAAGDAPGYDLPAFADKAPQAAHVLEIDEVDLVNAELADFAPAEPAALDGLLGCRGNGSLLPLLELGALERDVVVTGAGFFGE
jgi:hypothetical protein